MTLVLPKNEQLIHLAVDVQGMFTQSLWDRKRRKTFQLAVRQFANDLAGYNVSTIWIAFGNEGVASDDFKLYSDKLTKASKIAKHGLEVVSPKENENVFIKLEKNAFDKPTLAMHLRERGIRGCIFTGMNSGYCVPESIIGALKEHFGCYVVYDKLASMFLTPSEDKNPDIHRQKLLDACRNAKKEINSFTSEELLNLLKLPVSKLANVSPQQRTWTQMISKFFQPAIH